MKRLGAFMLSFFMILSLSACGSEGAKKSLLEWKTPYVGDSTKVLHIVQDQGYEGAIEAGSIAIQSKEEPYGLIVNIKVGGDEATEETLFKNAALTFSLIENLTTLEYRADDKTVATYSREKVEEELKARELPTLDEISESEETLDKFIREF